MDLMWSNLSFEKDVSFIGSESTENPTFHLCGSSSQMLLGYCSNHHTIAPKNVYLDMNFAWTLARCVPAIIIDEKIFQRLQIFCNSNDTKQESVQI